MSKGRELIKIKQISYCRVPDFIIVDSIDDFNMKKNLLSKDKTYAVRSSANCEDGKKYSFAGVFNTYLNIKFEDIESRLQDVFDLSMCPNLQYYLDYFNLSSTDIKLESVIQEMIDCSVSGVCFSINPATLADECVIEAVWGLGYGLVSGKYLSDQIVVDEMGEINYRVNFQRFKLTCSDSGIGEIRVPCIEQSMKKLNAAQIEKLIFLINKLKNYRDSPFEIEWGFYHDRLYVFQIRPITAINH